MIDAGQKQGILCLMLAVLCFALASCSRDPSATEVARYANAEYLYASACDGNTIDMPEGCSSDGSHLVGMYRVGDVELRIPRQILQQPVTETRELERVSYGFCWPGLDAFDTGCGSVANKILLYVTEAIYVAPPASSIAVRRKTEEELLTERTVIYYTGPYRLQGTQVDEYRHRNQNSVAPIFSFTAKDDVRIAQCDHTAYGRCIVSVRDIKGLNIRYEFGVDLIVYWQGIDSAVIDSVVSFVAETNGTQ
jgi:hypothetical protein